MRGARTWLLAAAFLHATAALQLALSPCGNRASNFRRGAGAPCMKYSAINDLSSFLLTDAEVAQTRRPACVSTDPAPPPAACIIITGNHHRC